MSLGPPVLEIRILGNVDVRGRERPLAPLESTRAVSLLGYLLVHRGVALPRERLAFLLWPDSTEAQARTNLRHVLHTLRRGLPDADRFVEVTSRTLRWRADAPYWLDLAEFDRALAEGRLAEAADAYGGDLLEGTYDDWVIEERERLRDRYLDTLERLLRHLEERQEWAAASRCAERLVRHDPLREDGHRALMRLHDARGERPQALRIYHAYAAALQRELDVEPSAAMRAAYEALLVVDPEIDSTSTQRATPTPTGPPLVGRAPERAQLSALWRSASRGRAQLVLVTGEPGVGKSRLVDELRSWCAHAGAITAEARAYAAEGAVAYAPIVAWLRADAIAARLRRLPRAHVIELARLLPELQTEMPGLPPPEPLSEAELRQRLFSSLSQALRAVSAPLLLVADDVQWFDPPSLQLLHYLVRSEPGSALLIAATARREELDPRDPVGELCAGLQALERFSEIELGRLSRADTELLAERMLGAPLDHAEAERLFADSEGNPLFLVEAVQAGTEGAISASPRSGGVVGRVQAVIAARLTRLSSAASELAGIAATIGREFSARVLADASDLEDQAFVGGLDELWRRGIVRAYGLETYDFSHGRIREAAYRALGPALRRRAHLRVARALERAHAGDLDAASSLLAAQYEAAGTADEAARWFVRAAHVAQRLHDHASAARALERALALCAELPQSEERDARELAILTALPAPLVALQGYRSGRLIEVHDRALALAEQLGVELEAPLVRSLALAALTRGDFPTAHAFGEQLATRGESAADDVLWVESAWVLGVAAYWSGQLNSARTYFEAALDRWRPEDLGEHLLRYGQDPSLVCTIRLAHTLWLLGHDADAARTRDAALALAEGSAHPFSRTLVTVFAALLALDRRDEPRLRAHVAALVGSGTGPTRRAAEVLAGFVEVLDGRTRDGLLRARRVVDEAEWGAAAAPGEEGLLLRVLLEACAVAGDARTGIAAADLTLQTSNGAQPWSAEVHRLRGAFLHALGAPRADVEAELRRATDVAEAQGAHALAARARETLALARAERSVERLGNGW